MNLCCKVSVQEDLTLQELVTFCFRCVWDTCHLQNELVLSYINLSSLFSTGLFQTELKIKSFKVRMTDVVVRITWSPLPWMVSGCTGLQYYWEQIWAYKSQLRLFVFNKYYLNLGAVFVLHNIYSYFH
jgi:hypothetical protein